MSSNETPAEELATALSAILEDRWDDLVFQRQQAALKLATMIGYQLRMARLMRGMTVEETSILSRVPEQKIIRLERGDALESALSDIGSICWALQVEPSFTLIDRAQRDKEAQSDG